MFTNVYADVRLCVCVQLYVCDFSECVVVGEIVEVCMSKCVCDCAKFCDMCMFPIISVFMSNWGWCNYELVCVSEHLCESENKLIFQNKFLISKRF